MSHKFDSTHQPDEQSGTINQKMAAKSLRMAFAVVGKLIGEGWFEVDFTSDTWHEDLKFKVQAVAEVIFDYE